VDTDVCVLCRLKEIELYVSGFEVLVTVECIEVILSDRLCQCGMYRDIIVLQSHIALHSEHFVWWCAAYIAHVSISIFCVVCCIAVNGRILLTVCQEGAGNGFLTRLIWFFWHVEILLVQF
jgi:hypothetical protein